VYEVNGRSYQVMRSAEGYEERGVASWYGQKFHGRLTSNRELYDMHGLTAAHKTLPLPTYVQVTNLTNGKSVIVRVNDRGPFVSNRIIDLSYAAARRIDMIDTGTSLVEVRALTGSHTVSTQAPRPAADTADRIAESAAALYLQVGAFGDPQNADRRFRLLQQGGIGSAFVAADYSVSPALYRVRIGPIETVEQYDALAARLAELGIEDAHLVSD
jgi:rare lipoprotein A